MIRRHPKLLRHALGVLFVVVIAALAGAWTGPRALSAREGECGWECKGLKCERDINFPDIRCVEEVPSTCSNFSCNLD